MKLDDTELLAIWWCLIVLAFLLGTAWVCNKLTKRNRRTRNGWRVTRQGLHDASCRSGWKAHVQSGHRY
jgi:hypothetical protein